MSASPVPRPARASGADTLRVVTRVLVPIVARGTIVHRPKVVAMAIDRRVGNEIIEMRVVRRPSGLYDGRRVVHELPEEAERICLGEPSGSEIADLYLEALRLVLQCTDCTIKFRFE